MKKFLWFGLILLIVIAGGIFFISFSKNKTSSPSVEPVISNQTEIEQLNNVGLANPASVNCVSEGGQTEIRTDEEGNQYGICKFSDGSECEEWQFFRGECHKGDNKK